jgi:hypothetical protein
MEEKESKSNYSIQYILERLSEILLQDENADVDTSFLSTPTEIDASPEEGASYPRVYPDQAARVARRYYQAYNENGRSCNIELAGSEQDRRRCFRSGMA